MPAGQRQQTTQSPSLPATQPTSKYINKDGSKFISVPKTLEKPSATAAHPTETHTMAQSSTKPDRHNPLDNPDSTTAAPTVNRKKQKRRQKQAARLAAEQVPGAQGTTRQQMQHLEERFRASGLNDNYEENGQFDPPEGEPYDSEEDGDEYSGSYGQNGSESPRNGYARSPQNPAGKKSKKKKKGKTNQSSELSQSGTNGVHNHAPLSLPPIQTGMPRGPGISKEKIWNTSSQEERERIKEFWLSLGEEERKSLVKVEKDAVLKKMKEQQKHSCSCTVCGRKRTAIEEELEVLYDAYYEELEQYANHQGDGPPMMPPPRRFGAMSGLQPPNRLPPAFNGPQPSRGRIVEQLGDDEEEDDEDDEEYSEDDLEEDEEYSEEEPEEPPRSHASEFFTFGNSLTVQGGILTVADDLLKNDGKKFIEMMEQLAERRMARDEDAQEYRAAYGHPPNGPVHSHSHAHNHPPPPPEDDEYDEEEEDEEEYDSQDEDYDEEEMDTMTEEQRMEEGRRMFQIFAARMFEQRVLTAYKEKVAKERQQKLLEELEEEGRAESQKKAKKAKDAQKKKDKIQQKKQALAEEKAKKDAERAAEEAALRAAEEKKAEEQRLKAEEKRKKREAQRKAEEEEKAKKEAEKQRRLQEQRDRQFELERKQREAKDKERKEKEELRQKEREAKEAKEREAKDRKEKQEREKRESEDKAKAEKEAKEKQKREDAIAQQAAAQPATQAASVSAQAPKRPLVPIPANLQPHSASVASPHVQVATPAVPKAPTPIRLRTSSQQESSGSSVPQTPQTGGVSQNVSPVPSTPLHGSPIGPSGKTQQQQPFLHHPQATSPIHSALKGPPGMPPAPFAGMQPLNMPFQSGVSMMPPGFGGRMHHDPMFPHQQPIGAPFRPIVGPGGIPNMPIHPGLGMHQIQQGRGFPVQPTPPGFPQSPNGLGGIGQPFPQKEKAHNHSRQQSASFEKSFDPSVAAPQAQPIARPAPIGRPSSIVHGNDQENFAPSVDDLSNHLGSSALLDDEDEPISGASARRSSGAPSSRQMFPPTPFGMEPSAFASPVSPYSTWGAPANPFGTSSLPGSNYMGGWGQSTNASFGSVGGVSGNRSSQARSVAVRLMICRACQNLKGSTVDGYYNADAVKEQVDMMNPPTERAVSLMELLTICETEGNPTNGGGSFDVRDDGNGQHSIRHEADLPSHRPLVPGEIGSPIVGGSRFGPPGF